MYFVGRYLVAVLVLVMLMGCSGRVSSEKVHGTYVTSYPFGAEMLTLNQDGSFVQHITVENQSPVTARGSWSFDSKESRVTLRGLMLVVDGFGKLKSDWQTVAPGLSSMDVEMHWFKIVIGSARLYPYMKIEKGSGWFS